MRGEEREGSMSVLHSELDGRLYRSVKVIPPTQLC